MIFYSLTLCALTLLRTPASNGANSIDFPSTKFKTFDMLPTSAAEHINGKLVLLDFWASWCEPCKDSLPFFAELENRYSKQGLQVIAVSVDEDLKAANAFVAKNKLPLKFLWDENKRVAKNLGLMAIPTTLLVDKSGKIIYQERGFSGSSKTKLEDQVRKALK